MKKSKLTIKEYELPKQLSNNNGDNADKLLAELLIRYYNLKKLNN